MGAGCIGPRDSHEEATGRSEWNGRERSHRVRLLFSVRAIWANIDDQLPSSLSHRVNVFMFSHRLTDTFHHPPSERKALAGGFFEVVDL
jgi:hypothetical protein